MVCLRCKCPWFPIQQVYLFYCYHELIEQIESIFAFLTNIVLCRSQQESRCQGRQLCSFNRSLPSFNLQESKTVLFSANWIILVLLLRILLTTQKDGFKTFYISDQFSMEMRDKVSVHVSQLKADYATGVVTRFLFW